MTTTQPHTILVLGATSAIGAAYVRQRAKTFQEANSALRVILVGRDKEKLDAEALDLRARSCVVEVHQSDLADHSNVNIVEQTEGFIDEAVLAYGALTDQSKAQVDTDYLWNQLAVNFVSASIWLERLAKQFESQGHGRALVIGSVAGDRGRQSNYAYGAAKSGLATFLSGLQHRFNIAKNIHFTLVKLGFVDSPMTAHIEQKGALWAHPDDIAPGLENALLKGKLTIYTPWFWWPIMQIIKHVPAFIFHKTKL